MSDPVLEAVARLSHPQDLISQFENWLSSLNLSPSHSPDGVQALIHSQVAAILFTNGVAELDEWEVAYFLDVGRRCGIEFDPDAVRWVGEHRRS